VAKLRQEQKAHPKALQQLERRKQALEKQLDAAARRCVLLLLWQQGVSCVCVCARACACVRACVRACVACGMCLLRPTHARVYSLHNLAWPPSCATLGWAGARREAALERDNEGLQERLAKQDEEKAALQDQVCRVVRACCVVRACLLWNERWRWARGLRHLHVTAAAAAVIMCALCRWPRLSARPRGCGCD
jgi:hypothetical protein